MNANPRDGGPAFPQPCQKDGHAANTPWGIAGGGLSIRDWFAGQSISPMLVQAYGSNPLLLAERAYEIADALLVVRNKEAK